MRGIVGYERSLNLLLQKSLTHCTKYHYFSLKYKSSAAPFSSLTPRGTNTTEPFTEKVRKKIWGTDQPPGQANPYEENSYLQRVDQATTDSGPTESLIQNLSVNGSISQYEPATVWDGLEQVGGSEDLLVKEWLPGNTFDDSFVPKDAVTNVEEITAIIHRVLVEIFVWQQANHQLADICMASNPSTDFTMNVNMTYSPKVGITLQYPDNTTMEKIIRSLRPEKSEDKAILTHESESSLTEISDNPTIAAKIIEPDDIKESEQSLDEKLYRKGKIPPEEATADNLNDSKKTSLESKKFQESVTSWDPSWMNIPITDTDLKFTVGSLSTSTRILQLSGIRVSDAIITSTTTVGILLKQIIKPPKNRKLADVLAEKEELSNLPNVSIHPRRITLRDRETKVGRWKLIEEEFSARGLISDKRKSVKTLHS
ncbi:hypothetical protein EPUL_002557 [Erysiphe pulchra]|uniref:Large ribosomal subunit protein mL50 n=1 Tax=Erysiphe pulchra TaxID=225359 RepID=A0A2S4PRY9_9PEZI|nr:hypothetical protein EPUL_002557 [Erysiphe pulchra]